MATIYILAFFSIALGSFFIGKYTALRLPQISGHKLHSRPIYHGISLSLYSVVPPVILSLVWLMVSDKFVDILIIKNFTEQLPEFDQIQIIALIRDAKALAFKDIGANSGAHVEQAGKLFLEYHSISRWQLFLGCALFAGLGFLFGYRSIKTNYRARNFVEKFVTILLALCSAIAILVTLGIVFSLLFETIAFFGKVSIFDFLFGMHWSPQSAFEGAGSEGGTHDYSLVFGAVPLFAGTFLITAIAMLIAAPVGLMAAIYLSDYSSTRFRASAKPLMEIWLVSRPSYMDFLRLLRLHQLSGDGENI